VRRATANRIRKKAGLSVGLLFVDGVVPPIVFGAVLLLYLAQNIGVVGLRVRRWDLLLLSGLGLLVVGLLLARTIEDRFGHMVERLRARGALEISDANLERLRASVDGRARAWAFRWAVVVSLVVLLAWTSVTERALHTHSLTTTLAAVSRGPHRLSFVFLVVVEVVGGFVAGFHLGRMASYGFAGMLFLRAHARLNVLPGHLDGVAGLKPVGDFYFFQASVAGLPALYLAVWSILIPLGFNKAYGLWEGLYVFIFLPLALAIEVLAFLVPIQWFHSVMAREKQNMLPEADRLSQDIAVVQERLLAMAAREVATERERLHEMQDRYRLLEDMPTWPVDPRTRRRLRLQNLALVLPILGQVVGRSELGKQIADLLRGGGH
jgi:hypothetical protein